VNLEAKATVVHRKRKVRKRRGSRTYGWGQVGQHRAGGRKGGKGKAGRSKHKWTYTVKYTPDYFGKRGFHRPVSQKEKTINVGELEELATRTATEEKGKIIDLERLGYDKLLGAGKVNRAMNVEVKSCSKSAAKKIQEAGGKILIKRESQSV